MATNVDLSVEVAFKRLEKATTLTLKGELYSEDVKDVIEVVIESVHYKWRYTNSWIISCFFRVAFSGFSHLINKLSLLIAELTAKGEVTVELANKTNI